MIRFVDAFEVDKSIIVVTELLAGGELSERSVHNQPQLHLKPTFVRCIDEEAVLTEQDCCTFMRQVSTFLCLDAHI